MDRANLAMKAGHRAQAIHRLGACAAYRSKLRKEAA